MSLWSEWEFDPGVIVPLALTALLYARGASRKHGVGRWRAACFWSGMTALTLALISPLHALGEELFSAHMVQHEILMLIAAPLLVFSRPLVPLLWGLPYDWRRAAGAWSKNACVQRAWRGVTDPLSAWTIHAAAIWIWHWPPFFQATLSSDWVHTAQHLSFLLSGLLFWWSLFYAHGRGYGAGVLYVFTTAVHTSILGALLTLTPSVWYPAYEGKTAAWGLAALEDQQLGGLVMWIPGGIVYTALGLYLFARWMRASEVLAARRWYAQ